MSCRVITPITPMNITPSRYIAASASFFVAFVSLFAQTVPPVVANTSEQEIIELSPFEVRVDASDTYQATNTNAITGTKLELSKVPLSAQVFNRSLMDDLALTDISDILTQVGGFGPPLNGAAEAAKGSQEGDLNDFKSFSVRGLIASNQRRDGFLRSDGTTLDNFDVETVESINGPQSLLYGAGDAGGVVNFVSKRAMLAKKITRLSAKFDSEGSQRYQIDANVGAEKFAIRVVGLNANSYFWRDVINQKSDGIYGALAIRPTQRVLVRAQYRHLVRNEISASGGTILYPASIGTPVGLTSAGIHTRLLMYSGTPEQREAMGGFWTWENADSPLGGTNDREFDHTYKDISVDVAVTDHFDLQFRWGADDRRNQGLQSSNFNIYHPNDTRNGLPGQWAVQMQPFPLPFAIGQKGPRVQGNLEFSIGHSSKHQLGFAYQALQSKSEQIAMRYYEVGASGQIIQDASQLNTTHGGRNPVPALWMPIFPEGFYDGIRWPVDSITDPKTGKIYKLAPLQVPGYGIVSATNPLGVNGAPGSNYTRLTTDEDAALGMLFSEWFDGRINTMLGYRNERFVLDRASDGLTRGPENKGMLTSGIVFDIVGGLQGYANYSTNSKIQTAIEQTDIFRNVLPTGEGSSKEVGFKFDLFSRRLSGAIAYFDAQSKNEIGTLGSGGTAREDVDPNGINGRHGGANYSYSKGSQGVGVNFTAQPAKGWQVVFGYSHADGKEDKDVVLPIFYNDEFNTMTSAGETVVAVKNSSTGALSPLMVRSVPNNSSSPLVPLSLAMMKNASSGYYAILDPESGYITNATALGLSTVGVGTGRTGLSITEHQLGFVAPNDGQAIVKRAGEKTTGYSADYFNLINRYRFSDGKLSGLAVGVSMTYQMNRRGYYYSDAADGNKRKLFMYPDRLDVTCFASYPIKITRKTTATIQVNIANPFDEQKAVGLVSSSTGVLRFGRLEYTPRKISVSSSLSF